MKIGTFSLKDYSWFEQIIRTMDALTHLYANNADSGRKLSRIQIDEALSSVKTQIKHSALKKLNTLQTNALIAYNMCSGRTYSALSDDSRQWTLITLNGFKQANLSVGVALKTNDFLVMATMLQYASTEVIIYCVYQGDATAQDLKEAPLAIFTLHDGYDIYNMQDVSISENKYTYVSSNNIRLEVSTSTHRVISCYMEEGAQEASALDMVFETLSTLSASRAMSNAIEEIKGTKDLALRRIQSTFKGVSLADREMQWLVHTFKVNFEEATSGIEKILKTARKGAAIDVFGNKFDVIDVMRYTQNTLMVRTSFFDESSQLVLLFEISNMVTTVAFCVIDVFPHKNGNGRKYVVSDIVQSSSRDNVLGFSSVTINGDDVLYVKEDITLQYMDVTYRVSDTIRLDTGTADTEDCDTKEANSKTTKDNEDSDKLKPIKFE